MVTMRYQIRVAERLSDESRAAFRDMLINEVPPETVLEGEVVDESHLHGIIIQLQVLGITVVSVHPIPD
jgi:hypothetical protein